MNGNSTVNFTQTVFFAAETGVCFSDRYANLKIVSTRKSITPFKMTICNFVLSAVFYGKLTALEF
jgi:hypothetical protein